MSAHLNSSKLDKAAGTCSPVKHVKHRSCQSCGKQRPVVLFPKLPNGAYRKKCQLCVDSGKRGPKDVVKLRSASMKAHRMRRKLQETRVETVSGEMETV